MAVYRCALNGEFIRHINNNPSLNLSTIIASLSLASSGGIQGSAGIAIDDDGFVYVCDFLTNGTITVF